MANEDIPCCGKCGAGITTGFMAIFCPKLEQCEFWPDDEESQQFLRSLRGDHDSNSPHTGND